MKPTKENQQPNNGNQKKGNDRNLSPKINKIIVDIEKLRKDINNRLK